MPDHVYKSVELTGSSPDGIQPARQSATSAGSKSRRSAAKSKTGKIAHWQVTMKVGFTLDG